MESLLEDLLTARVSCAPHVLTVLAGALQSDAPTIRQVAEALTPAQRQGLRPLPEPLPLVPAITDAFADRQLPALDRKLLLAIALSLDDRLAPLLDFDGRDAADIVAGPLGVELNIRAGRIRFIDRRWTVWMQWRSTPGEQVAVHERLSEVFDAHGDQVSRDWHRARASLHASPESAPELIRIARELSEAGHPARALQLASEAAAHATGVERDEAELVAGASAAGAGFALEASIRLGALFPSGTERFRLQGFSGILIAQSFLQGAVPDLQPRTFRPTTDDADDWYSWTRAVAFAAVLCAERGERSRMRVWLDALREGSARVGVERELRDPVVALSWLLAGDTDVDDVSGSGPFSGRMLRALREAVDGDIDHALHVLDAGGSGVDGEVDPFVAGFEHSPVVQAYRAVAEALLLFWRGDVAMARDRLIGAALTLPVAIPFAGLGVVLARRLDVAVLGELGPFSRALTGALPAPVKIDLLVDRSIQSYLAGAWDDAEAARRLWLERGAPQPGFVVPGLDDAEARSPGGHRRRVIRPRDLALAAHLQRRAAAMTERDRGALRHEIQELARGVRSPFARAHVEAALGMQCAVHGDNVAARDHLRAALRLFEISGASAWAKAVELRLARWASTTGPEALPPDPLAASRRAWTALLTPREVEVAMLAVGGASNREIAEELQVSVRTVEVHLGRVFAKLDVRTRVELTVLAHRTEQYV